MENDIVIECPRCHTQFTCPPELEGTIGTCRPCGNFKFPVFRIGHKSPTRGARAPGWALGWFGRLLARMGNLWRSVGV